MTSTHAGTKRPLANYLALSFILLFVGTTITIVQYKVPSILDSLMAQFAMDSSEASLLMSVFTAMGIVLSLPTGSLAKRLGPKRVLLLGCGVIVAGSVLGALATSAWIMVLSRAVEGIAFVFITVAGPIAIEKYVSPDNQGTANGIWSLWICFGSVIGSTATPMVFQALGLAGTWLAYAVLVVVAAVILACFVRVPPAGDDLALKTDAGDCCDEDGGPVRLASYAAFLKPNALLFFFAYLVFNIEILAVLSYTPTFLQSQGMNASLSGFASSLPGLLAALSAPVFGKLIDKTGRTKPFLLLSLAVAAPATFLMLTQAGWLLWAGAFLMGLVGYGLPVACLTALPQIAGEKRMLAAAMGFLMTIQALGEFLGSLVTPMLLGPDMSNWLFCGTIIGIIGLCGAAAVALCRFK